MSTNSLIALILLVGPDPERRRHCHSRGQLCSQERTAHRPPDNRGQEKFDKRLKKTPFLRFLYSINANFQER
jgi:hypothetical protein